ncbi:hypothetical protein KQI65_11060 [bacterium]|nr:hypothetical protein [bacterium]
MSAQQPDGKTQQPVGEAQSPEYAGQLPVRAVLQQYVSPAQPEQDNLRALKWQPGDMPTIATQVGLGVAGFVVAEAVTVPFALMGTHFNLVDHNTENRVIAFAMITGISGALGLTQGVIWGGDIFEGNGNGWWTLLGSAAGITLGMMTATGMDSDEGWAVGAGMALTGPILAYHLSAEPVYVGTAYSPSPPLQQSACALQPTGMHDNIPLLQLSIPLGE